MKNFQQMVMQRSQICSCLLTRNRLQMPKAMPTIPEEEVDHEDDVLYELLYQQDQKKRLEDDTNSIRTDDASDGCSTSSSTSSSIDLSLSLSTSGEESQLEPED